MVFPPKPRKRLESGPSDVYDSSRRYTVRTNIDIDDRLMSDALKAGKFRTKREAVEEGLRLVVRMRAQDELRKLRGKIDWQGDLDAMRRDN